MSSKKGKIPPFVKIFMSLLVLFMFMSVSVGAVFVSLFICVLKDGKIIFC